MDFKELGNEVIYSGRVFDLERVRFRQPDGREHTYDLVRHKGAVVILAVDEQGQIWFVRQYRVGALQQLLELPAGLLEEGEEAEVSAGRELQEEIGMAASSLVKLGEFYMVPGYSTEKLTAFLAQGLTPSALPTDEDEFLERQAIPVWQAYEMAENGDFQDGKTLATLLLAKKHLQSYLEI